MCSVQQKVVAHSEKMVNVKDQGQCHLKEKYYDSNSSNDFAQNQHADCPWHADFVNNNHFSKVNPFDLERSKYCIPYKIFAFGPI